ncbi:MAG: hypothetical protein ABSE89_07960 [Sedimentisphaerales bacterium]
MRQFDCLSPSFYLKNGIIPDFDTPIKQLKHFFYILFSYGRKPAFSTIFQYFIFKNPEKKCLPNRSLCCIVVCGLLIIDSIACKQGIDNLINSLRKTYLA